MPAKARYRRYRNAKLKIGHLTAEKPLIFGGLPSGIWNNQYNRVGTYFALTKVTIILIIFYFLPGGHEKCRQDLQESLLC
jgi:hypothetical protein